MCSTHQPLVAGESTGLGVGVKAAQNYRGNASNKLHFKAILRFWGWGSKFGVWGLGFEVQGLRRRVRGFGLKTTNPIEVLGLGSRFRA